jgi:hypothetical protein
MSWLDNITGQVGDTLGDAWNTAREGGEAWLKDRVGEWSGGDEQQGRPETVNQDPSPMPYTGDQAAQQQRAAAMQATNAKLMNWALMGLGAFAAYMIYTGSGR